MPHSCLVNYYDPHFMLRKQRPSEFYKFIHGHIANERQGRDSNPGIYELKLLLGPFHHEPAVRCSSEPKVHTNYLVKMQILMKPEVPCDPTSLTSSQVMLLILLVYTLNSKDIDSKY